MKIVVTCLISFLIFPCAWATLPTADSIVDWSQVSSLKSLTGGAVQKLDVGARGHRAGSENIGLYKFKNPAGDQRLIKVLRMPYRAGQRNPHFAEEVDGMILAASVGGPKIFRGGRIEAGGEDSYYVEMENVFPDEASFTLKGLYDFKKSWTSHFRPLTISKVQLHKIAKMIREVIERGLVINDVDFIFNHADDVRWLDGAKWARAIQENSIARETGFGWTNAQPFRSYAYIFNFLSLIRENYGDAVLSALHGEVFASTRWTSEQKNYVWAQLKKYLIADARWPEARIDLAARTKTDCSDDLINKSSAAP